MHLYYPLHRSRTRHTHLRMSSVHNENDALVCPSVLQGVEIFPFVLATVVALVDDFISVIDDGLFVFVFVFVLVLFVFRARGILLLLFCRGRGCGGDGGGNGKGSEGVSKGEEKA